MLPHPIHDAKAGEVGIGLPSFEVGEIVAAQRRRNPLKKNFKATVVERRCVRGSTNRDDWTVCQMVYFSSCGLCCRSCAASSIEERYLYKLQYIDDRSQIDIDMEEEYITKIVEGEYDDDNNDGVLNAEATSI